MTMECSSSVPAETERGHSGDDLSMLIVVGIAILVVVLAVFSVTVCKLRHYSTKIKEWSKLPTLSSSNHDSETGSYNIVNCKQNL